MLEHNDILGNGVRDIVGVLHCCVRLAIDPAIIYANADVFEVPVGRLFHHLMLCAKVGFTRLSRTDHSDRPY